MQARFKSGLWITAYTVVFLLLIVWQMPGTIGLRYGLLGLLLPIVLVLCYWQPPKRTSITVNRLPLVLLAALTGWIVLVIVGWGQNPAVSWSEFRGQWLSALATGLVGLLLSKAALKDSDQRVQTLLTVVFWSLLTQVLLHDLMGALYWFSTGNLPFRQAPVFYIPDLIQALFNGWPWQETFTGTSPDKFSYVNNMLAALLVAELAQRLLLHKRWLRCGGATLVVGFVATLLCSYWLQMRNGNVGLLLLLTFAALMIVIRLAHRLGVIRVVGGGLVITVALAILGTAMVRSDPRWQKLVDTVPVALDTQANRTWLTMDQNYPRMANGEVVDASAYERLAWMKEGFVLILGNPLGTGYNRLAYGAGIDEKYHMQGAYRSVHSHSGVIDFAIANGIMGLALWLTFLASLCALGWQAFRTEQVGMGLMLMFVITGFVGRSLVDSNIRDHVLQQFLFMAMLFYGLVAAKQKNQLS